MEQKPRLVEHIVLRPALEICLRRMCKHGRHVLEMICSRCMAGAAVSNLYGGEAVLKICFEGYGVVAVSSL
jgi:hypothetical protein